MAQNMGIFVGFCLLCMATACKKNSDCPSKWCEGGTLLSSGSCQPQRPDGQQAKGGSRLWDYNICLAGTGQCGICGNTVPDGSVCTSNSDCTSVWCEGRGSCSGRCKARKADGTRISCTDVISIGSGGCDYNICEARAGKCGVCGNTVPDGSTCSENPDCKSGWCEGFPSVGCKGTCKPKLDDGVKISCNDPTKVSSAGCDYNQCKAGQGKCGICGAKVPSGTPCSAQSDCSSGVCRLPTGILGTSAGCNGMCVDPLPDGSTLPRLSWPIKGAYYDYSECKAKNGICGVCGTTVGEGALCSASSDCATATTTGPGLCCGGLAGGRISVNCQGTCVQVSPSACPTLVDLKALKAAGQALLDAAKKFGECLVKEVVESTRDEYSCEFSGSPGDMTAKLSCASLDPEKARRLAAADESGSWARRFGYSSAEAAHAAPVAGYYLGQPEEHGAADGRQLLGIGSAAAPKSSKLACKQNTNCQGGAALSVVANLDFKPKLTVEADAKGGKVTVHLEGDMKGTAGFGVIAAGSCTMEKDYYFPEAPKPVATYCFYALCVTVMIQGSLTLNVEGSLKATANAEYHTLYKVLGKATLDLTGDTLDQSANADFSVTKVSDWWKLRAAGEMSASVSVKIGPVVTILLVPGVFASVIPYVMGEVSLYGVMSYEQSSADKPPEGITAVSWPTDSDVCSSSPKAAKKANITQTAGKKSKKAPASSSGQGKGFSVSADLVGIEGQCFASGLALVTGVEATVLGPHRSISDLTELTLSQVGLAAINCAGKQITGKDDFDAASGVKSLVSSLIEKIPQNPIDAIPVLQTEVCFDLWGDYVGDSSCLCQVGCARRQGDDSCKAPGAPGSGFASAGQGRSCSLLLLCMLLSLQVRRGFSVEIEGKLPRPPWQEPQDLSWYYQQQKSFLSDLKVAEDRHEAWNSKVVTQHEEIENLRAQVRAIQSERDGTRKDLKEALRERDEWQVSALRAMSSKEFRSSVDSLEVGRRRPLPP
ncbi:unnamed protein product [Polarella glacialis]|uniref:Uncharacterized protein n=1 Tax=Polarella glacialis TaxID=89957 RepID=A0A813LB11_POLGL|nr:unnamed protein product [Polarella glacialis]